MLFRKIGQLIRGKATPFQLMAACVLGATLGFMPGWAAAPGLTAALLLLLVVLNANLLLATLIGLGAKLLSLAAMPAVFALGRFLLDGPTRGLLESAINAPVLAWFGFEVYVTTGGLVAGLIVGVLVGLLVVKTISGYRRKMVELEKNSERFQQFTSRRWVKFLTFVLVGSGPGKKVTYEQLLNKKVGNPIRTLGAVFVALLVLLLFLLQGFVQSSIVTAALQSGLERINGATVDVGGVELDLKAGRLTLTGLAMADPNRLDTDVFRAASIEADVSAPSLLRKRMHLDRVLVRDATHGEKRQTPGRRYAPPPEEPKQEPPPPEGTKRLEDYLRDAAVWKERLAQAKRWLDKLSGPEEEEPATTTEPESTAARAETLRERLERQVEELGYRRVRADHLVQKTPTFTIGELTAGQVHVVELKDETLDITARNLSTHPALLGQAPEITVVSSKDTLGFATRLGRFDATPGDNTLSAHYHGLPTDAVAGQLKLAGEKPLTGGTIDLDAKGALTTRGGVRVSLPLVATLHQVTLAMPGMQPTPVDRLEVPIALEGRLDRPRIRVDDQGLAKALVKAGVQRATDEATARAKEELNKQVGEQLGNQIGEQGGQLLQGILGGKKKE